MKGLFITASDTGVGKTRIACQLLRAAAGHGLAVRARKPVESGCRPEGGRLIAADGAALAEAAGTTEPDRVVTPLRFAQALAPDQAARADGQRLLLDSLAQAACNAVNPGDFVVVEGAGGFYSPLAEDGLNADLAKRLGLPLVIVVDDRLGAINQALLTLAAAEREGLEVRALVLNERERGASLPGNAEALRRRIPVPLMICPFNGQIEGYPASLFD
jgi:dethiobiotin synthetase